MIYIAFAILYRFLLIANQNKIWEWYQMYFPRWMPKCEFCLAYNISGIEWILWTIGIKSLL